MLLAGQNYGSLTQSFPNIPVPGIVIFMLEYFQSKTYLYSVQSTSILSNPSWRSSNLRFITFTFGRTIKETIRDQVKLNMYIFYISGQTQTESLMSFFIFK
jgi:hypothetical protein